MWIMQESVTIDEALKKGVLFFEQSHISSPRLEAEILLAYTLNVERIDLYRFPEKKIPLEIMSLFETLIKQRADGAPTAYLRKKKEFFSLTFKVGPGVLIPRADTEVLIEESCRLFPSHQPISILDLGTGSGAILITLLKEYPYGYGVGIDISETALNYAKENSRAHKVDERARFLKGDFFSALKQKEKFDLIISNPPYLASGEITTDLKFEPYGAFYGGEDGLESYRKIIPNLWSFLKSPGYCILEIDPKKREPIETLLKHYKNLYRAYSIKKDISGQDRVILISKGDEMP